MTAQDLNRIFDELDLQIEPSLQPREIEFYATLVQLAMSPEHDLRRVQTTPEELKELTGVDSSDELMALLGSLLRKNVTLDAK